MKSKHQPKVILLGPQAAGKGTQAHILSTWSGAPRMSMGDLLRDIQKEDTDRGRIVKELLAKGDLVPNEIIIELIKNWVDQHPDGWIIDGFPRTVEQAQTSAGFLKPDAVIFLELPDEEAKKRLSYRRVCAKCKTNYNTVTQPPKNKEGVCDLCGGELLQRADDKPEVVEERLRTYHSLTEPVKEWYKEKDLLLDIDAKPGIPQIAHEIQTQLEEKTGHAEHKKEKKWWILGAVIVGIIALAALAYIGSLQ